MFNTEVITLRPGVADMLANPSQRPDWSPFAQPPDAVTGIMAHTPDPAAYHDTGDGRTMLPRATRHYGSRGFSVRPGVLNIDPTDPVKGTGGFTVDVEQVTKEAADRAAEASGGDPLMAWYLAAGAVNNPQPVSPEPRVAPQGYPGYVVPHANPGGAQVIPTAMPQTVPPAASALAGPQPVTNTVQNPAIKSPGAAPMQPQPVVSGVVPPTPQAYPQPQQLPQVQPPAPQAPPQPPYPSQPPQASPQPPPWAQAPPAPQYPPWAQATPAPQYPPQHPLQQPAAPQIAPAPAAESAQFNMAMVQVLHAMTEKLAAPSLVREAFPPAAAPDQLLGMGYDVEKEKRAMLAEHKLKQQADKVASAGLDEADGALDSGVPIPEDAGLGFLTDPPSAPKVQVLFNLGAGGKHLKRYHHVAVSGFWLTLVYDSRFEGDQFIPAPTKEGDPPIELSFPQHGKTIKAAVPNGANQRIGCMDLLNFCIIGQETTEQQTAPVMADFGQMGKELQQMTQELGQM